MRERYGRAAALIGMTTYEGTVTAADDWGGDHRRKRVREALPGSIEALFHQQTAPNFLLSLRDAVAALDQALGEWLERAIGIIYRPDTERQSHYFHARIAQQFDAVLHFHRASALEPLDEFERWDRSEAPETYPSGL